MLERAEYVEQAYFFRTLLERLGQNIPLQELMEQAKFELLASTKLPMAIDLLLAELKHRGRMSAGMGMLEHYFVSAWVPPATQKNQFYSTVNHNRYGIGMAYPAITVPSGHSAKQQVTSLWRWTW